MKDFYKQEIEKVAMEKIAARAWKKYLPKLSDANYNRLLESGVYNPNRELKGLRRGTHAIMNKYNAKLLRNPSKAADSKLEMIRDINANANNTLDFKLPQYYIDKVKKEAPMEKTHSTSRAIVPAPGDNPNKPLETLKGKKTGYAYVPKNEHNNTIYNFEKKHPGSGKRFFKEELGLEPISRRDRDGRKWTQAITERHEADEIRYSNNLSRKGKKEALDKSYFSHISPKVLAQESANVGLMPRSVKKNQHKALRNDFSNRAGTTEANSISSLTGTPYGSSAVYDKKGANKAEKHWFNNETYIKD